MRQHVHARAGRYPERSQLAGPDVVDRTGYGSKENLHLPAKQSDDRRPAATKRHMYQVDAREFS